jgi:hypothetical protein
MQTLVSTPSPKVRVLASITWYWTCFFPKICKTLVYHYTIHSNMLRERNVAMQLTHSSFWHDTQNEWSCLTTNQSPIPHIPSKVILPQTQDTFLLYFTTTDPNSYNPSAAHYTTIETLSLSLYTFRSILQPHVGEQYDNLLSPNSHANSFVAFKHAKSHQQGPPRPDKTVRPCPCTQAPFAIYFPRCTWEITSMGKFCGYAHGSGLYFVLGLDFGNIVLFLKRWRYC